MELNDYLPSNSPVFFVEESDDENDEIGNGSRLFNNENSFDISSFCEAYCTDPRYNLGLLQDETQDSTVAESPPCQSSTRNESSKVQYLPGLLPNSSDCISNCSPSVTPSAILSASQCSSSKRPIKQSSRGRGRPPKLIKLEGVTSKLNGKVYQVHCRGLDVLEAIDSSITSVANKMHKSSRSSPNIRLLNLHLNQIETIINILENDAKLELEMSLELWNEIFYVTKTTFHNMMREFEQYQKKSFATDFSTENLSKVFSKNLNISSQCKDVELNKTEKTENNKSTRKSARSQLPIPSSATIPIQLVTLDQEEISPNVEEVDFIVSSQKPSHQPRRPPKNSKSPTVARGETSRKAKRNPTNKSKGPLLAQELNSKSCKSGEHVVAGTSKDSNGLLALFQQQDLASQSAAGEAHTQSSREHVVPESVPIVNKDISFLPESPLASQSFTVNSTEEVIIEQYKSSQSTNSDDQSQRSNITLGTASSQLKSLLTKTPSEVKLKRICKMAKMNFSLRPFVASKVLSPGTDNIRMSFDSKVYVGSLKIDGSIAMKSFTFPSIGSWFKSVIGQLFTSLYKSKEKLEVLYYDQLGSEGKWQPLDEIIQLDDEPSKTVPKRRYTEIPFTTLLKPSQSNAAPAAGTTKTQLPEQSSRGSGTGEELTMQLVPDEMIRHIEMFLVHSPAEFFRTHNEEEFWNGTKPFPKHFLDEIDQW